MVTEQLSCRQPSTFTVRYLHGPPQMNRMLATGMAARLSGHRNLHAPIEFTCLGWSGGRGAVSGPVMDDLTRASPMPAQSLGVFWPATVACKGSHLAGRFGPAVRRQTGGKRAVKLQRPSGNAHTQMVAYLQVTHCIAELPVRILACALAQNCTES